MEYQVKHMGQHRGNARLWFETQQLTEYGFHRGVRYDVVRTIIGIDLVASPQGTRTVSGKDKAGKVIPIIDINSTEVLGELATQPAVKVVYREGRIRITKLSSAELQDARLRRLTKGLQSVLLTAALCFGGGVMDTAAHAGLADAGVSSELSLAVEIDGDLLDHAAEHAPVITARTRLYNTPMQELVQDAEAMKELPKVDLLVTGIPCSGASVSGKSKLGLSKAEDHPEVGHLVVPYLMLVNALQPSVAVVECVVPYSQSASASLMRLMFRDMGYTTQEVVLNAHDFGSIEARSRWFLVATTNGLSVSLDGLVPPAVPRPRLGEYLTDVPADRWSAMPGLKAKQVRDKAAGKGFAMQIVNAETTKIGVIGKDYSKNRSTEPKVQHPDNPDLLRLLTPEEHAAIKGVPVAHLGDLPATTAHQLLGQGVDTRPVRALFGRIGSELKRWNGKRATASVPYSLGRATG
jgi:DNA (cytosine-5)-methyltransferase 1